MCELCLPKEWSRRSVLAMLGAAVASPLLTNVSLARALGPAVALAPGVDIQPRDAWGADLPPLGAMSAEDVKFLLVHHTAGPNNYSQDQAAQQLRDVYRYHTSSAKGWPDVCYNFFVDRYGGVWEGRAGSLDGPVVADATGGSQGFAQLVCVLGDFTSQLPTPEATDATVRLLAWLAGRYGIDTTSGATVEFTSRGSNRWGEGDAVTARTISGHRDMSQTACPGDLFYPLVANEFQSRVSALRGQSPAPAPAPAPAPVTPAPVAPNPPGAPGPPAAAQPAVEQPAPAPTSEGAPEAQAPAGTVSPSRTAPVSSTSGSASTPNSTVAGVPASTPNSIPPTTSTSTVTSATTPPSSIGAVAPSSSGTSKSGSGVVGPVLVAFAAGGVATAAGLRARRLYRDSASAPASAFCSELGDSASVDPQ